MDRHASFFCAYDNVLNLCQTPHKCLQMSLFLQRLNFCLHYIWIKAHLDKKCTQSANFFACTHANQKFLHLRRLNLSAFHALPVKFKLL